MRIAMLLALVLSLILVGSVSAAELPAARTALISLPISSGYDMLLIVAFSLLALLPRRRIWSR
jgi:hypothetical protein